MQEIVVLAKIDNDPPAAELAELVSALESVPGVQAARVASEPMEGHAVTWDQILAIWIPWKDIGEVVAGAALKEVVTRVVDWLRERKRENPKRPRTVTIYGSDGKPLSVVRVTAGEAEPRLELPSNDNPWPKP